MENSQSINSINSQEQVNAAPTEQPQIQQSDINKITEQLPKTSSCSVDSKETKEADRKTLTQQVPVNETQANSAQAKNKVRQFAEKVIGEARTTKIINYIGESYLANFSKGLKKAALGSLAIALTLFVSCLIIGGTIIGSLAIGAVVGTIALIGAAVAYAKFAQLILQCKELEKTVENCQSNCEEIKKQNESIQNELNGANATLKDQKQTIQLLEDNNGALQKECDDAKTTANNLAEACERQIEEQNQIIAEKEKIIQEKAQELEQAQKDITTLTRKNIQLKDQVETYCNAFKGLVLSQEKAIENLRQQLEAQQKTTSDIIEHINEIRNGEKELTEALKFAQERIAAGQKLLSDIAILSANMTDSTKLSQMIKNGTLVKNAEQIQAKTQEVTKILSELSTGLSDKIISAQTNISQSRKAAAEEVKRLQQQIDEASKTIEQQKAELEAKKAEIENKEKEIAKEQEKYQTLYGQANETVKTLCGQANAKIDKAKKILDKKDKTIAAQNAKTEKLNEELSTIKVKKAELDGQLTEMQNKLQEQEKKINELVQQNSELKNHNNNIIATNSDQAETIKKQEELNAYLTKQVEDLCEKLTKMQESSKGVSGSTGFGWSDTLVCAAGTLVTLANPVLGVGIITGFCTNKVLG